MEALKSFGDITGNVLLAVVVGLGILFCTVLEFAFVFDFILSLIKMLSPGSSGKERISSIIIAILYITIFGIACGSISLDKTILENTITLLFFTGFVSFMRLIASCLRVITDEYPTVPSVFFYLAKKIADY